MNTKRHKTTTETQDIYKESQTNKTTTKTLKMNQKRQYNYKYIHNEYKTRTETTKISKESQINYSRSLKTTIKRPNNDKETENDNRDSKYMQGVTNKLYKETRKDRKETENDNAVSPNVYK